MVSLRHMPPAKVPVLKNAAFDLMTRSGFTARAPAEPEHWTIHQDTRWIGKTARPLRSTVRPKNATAPALGPGHEVRGGSECRASPSPSTKLGVSETLTAARPLTPSG